jgi:hypothetical protein
MHPFRTLLELRIETEPCIDDSLSRFRSLARTHGLNFRPIHLPGLQYGGLVPEKYREDIKTAHGYWLRWPGLLEDEFTNQVVMPRVRSGEAWMIAHADRNYRAAYDSLLKEFGIATTDVGVFRAAAVARKHPRIVEVDRQIDAASFRDSYLFRGVNCVSLTAIQGLICTGDSQSVLAVPDRDIELVDARDLFTSWPTPEVPCIGIWRSPVGKGGLIVLSCGFYRDPYSGPLGDYFPEIAGEQNELLCSNLLRLIADVPIAQFGWDEAAAAVRQIESNLFEITKGVLTTLYNDNWWDSGVPEVVRAKCRARREGEHGAFHDSAYMDLLDYKKIWKGHWDALRPVLDRQGLSVTNKDRALSFFDRVNPIRQKVAHPTKTVASGQNIPSDEERDELKSSAKLLIRIHQDMLGLRTVAP